MGVPKTASNDEIKRAYRKLAREFHPDVNKSAGASDKFKEINEAYQTLSDANKRSQYDYYGHAGAGAGTGQGGFSGFDFGGGGNFQGFENFGEFSDLFDTFFGGQQGSRKQRQQRGSDLRIDLRITLEEAFHGIEKEIEVPHFVACANCKGTGAKPGTSPIKCTTCNGAGQVRKTQRTILGNFAQIVPCSACHGSGETIKEACPECRGDGRAKKKHLVKIKVPAGIDNGYQLRVSGAGDAGVKGASPGDLYAFIQVLPHVHFNREGDNLYYNAKISFVQAILGDEIEVPTLDGKYKLKIPKGTQPNASFRLKGKGMPSLNYHQHGDLYITIEVQIPKEVTRDQEDLLKKFKNA